MKQPLRILIVEDNPGDVDLIREMVPRSGLVNFHIFAVEQLSDALPHSSKERSRYSPAGYGPAG